MRRPPPKPDWQSASKKGVEVRKIRAEVKKKIAFLPHCSLYFLRYGRNRKGSAISHMRVADLLSPLPGIGRVKLARVMLELGIASRKRIAGLGSLQYVRLEAFLKTHLGIQRMQLFDLWTDVLDLLTIVAGPTAVGKGTVISHLRKCHPQVKVSISATTREPRDSERDGIDYYFVTDEVFDCMVRSGQMLEWATVHGLHKYGTPKEEVERLLHTGQPVILEIDLQGMRKIRKILPAVRTVILLPPAWDDLICRIKRRGSESQDEIDARLATAKKELEAIGEFDYKIVNADVEIAANELWLAMNRV